MNKVEIGDIVVCPLPNRLLMSDIDKYVMTVTYINENEVVGTNAEGDETRCKVSDATHFVSYKALLNAITEKGVELCARATSR